jgi:hypothetical protein
MNQWSSGPVRGTKRRLNPDFEVSKIFPSGFMGCGRPKKARFEVFWLGALFSGWVRPTYLWFDPGSSGGVPL